MKAFNNVYISLIHNFSKLEQLKYLLSEEQIKKLWYIHITEYYSAI